MVQHGHDGWELVEYEWDPISGLGLCLYERPVKGSKHPEQMRVPRHQPIAPVRRVNGFSARG